jgi:UDP-glucuronate 4-epimerase
MAIFKFVDAIMAGRTIELYNYGRLQRDFTYIDDVVEAIVRVMPLPPELEEKRAGASPSAPMRLCNIGNQNPVELLHLIRTIEQCLGRSPDIRLAPMQPGDVYETQARVDRLRDVTGYSPRISIEEGVQRFVDWYLCEYIPLGLAEIPWYRQQPLPMEAAALRNEPLLGGNR